MNRLYNISFTGGLFTIGVVLWSPWLLAAGIVCGMLFLAYRIYASRLYTVQMRAAALEDQVDSLHGQLDLSIRKEQRLSKTAEQALAVKKQVMVSMSHEIRTPMNGVMGMAGLLAEMPLNDLEREYVNGIRQCGEQLLAVVNRILVDDMLNISKTGDNNNSLAIADFDLRSCIEEVLDMFAGGIGDTGPDLLYSIDEGIPAQLSGDSGRIRQILINLVDNAVKFTSRGEIFIRVHLLRKVENDSMELGFEVRDTGRGIPGDKLEGLFAGLAGKVADSSEKEASGLGLFICKRLVEMMDGWIEVQSEPEKGSVFTFCVRISPARKPLRNSLHPHLETLKNKRILIVDDNAVARGLLAGQLQKWDVVPATAGSGREALSALSVDASFDLIIADHNMPVMDGMALARAVGEQYPAIPVILLSRPGDQRYKTEEQLFYAVLAKPVKQHLLRDQLFQLFSSPDNGQRKTNASATGEKLPADFAEHHPLRLLIAEDNPINQKLALRMLTKLGYEPKMTSNGKEALEELSQKRYDLIFMDVQMPEMDGLEASRMIRLCLDNQPIIIAMTANALQGDRDSCLQAGMDDYISKPIDSQELLAQLEKWSATLKKS